MSKDTSSKDGGNLRKKTQLQKERNIREDQNQDSKEDDSPEIHTVAGNESQGQEEDSELFFSGARQWTVVFIRKYCSH